MHPCLQQQLNITNLPSQTERKKVKQADRQAERHQTNASSTIYTNQPTSQSVSHNAPPHHTQQSPPTLPLPLPLPPPPPPPPQQHNRPNQQIVAIPRNEQHQLSPARQRDDALRHGIRIAGIPSSEPAFAVREGRSLLHGARPLPSMERRWGLVMMMMMRD